MVNYHRSYKFLIFVSVFVLFCFPLLKNVPVTVLATSASENLSMANPNTDDDVGPVLHAWCWKFEDVSRYINEISHAGFKSVQVSPVQPAKKTDDEKRDDLGKKKMFRTWWSLYQPLDFKVGNCLGTEEDFKEMCDTAHMVGIKIIVDVVANHLAEPEAGEKGHSGQINPALITDVGVNCLFHEKGFDKREDSGFQNREQMTHYSLGGVPDLNTGNEDLQKIIIRFLRRLMSLGADGFRFDAAKHIELPEDGESVRSDFWGRVINSVKKVKPDLFIYGEVLHNDEENNIKIGGKSIEEAYLKYMNITDSQMGDFVCRAIREKNADIVNIGCCGGSIETDPGHFVTWVESHDNYQERKTTDLDFDSIKLGWAIVASRASSVPLYLARPVAGVECLGDVHNVVMCGPGDLWWTDRTIAEINRFRAASRKKGEYIIKCGEVIVIVRVGVGAVVVNLSDSGKNICANVGFDEVEKKPRLESDTYYCDVISKSTFHVDKSANLRGYISGRGVAVIYNVTGNPRVYFAGGKKYKAKINMPIILSSGKGSYTFYRFDFTKKEKTKGEGEAVDGNEGNLMEKIEVERGTLAENTYNITIGQGLQLGEKTVLTLEGIIQNDFVDTIDIQSYIFEKCDNCDAIVKAKKRDGKKCCLYSYTLSEKGSLIETCRWGDAPEMEEDGKGYCFRKVNGNQQVIIKYVDEKNPENVEQFPKRMQPGIIVHPGEEVIIESIKEGDFQSVSVSNMKVVPSPSSAVDVPKAD